MAGRPSREAVLRRRAGLALRSTRKRGHPRRGLVTPARPRNRRVCCTSRSRPLLHHTREEAWAVKKAKHVDAKDQTWQPWHEQRDQSRGPPPDATVRRLRAGAHAASSSHLSRQDRARYKTRADARENDIRHTTRAREPPRLAGGAHPGTRLSRRAAAAPARPRDPRERRRRRRDARPHDPGPARAAAAAGTPHTHTHPPTRVQVALREE